MEVDALVARVTQYLPYIVCVTSTLIIYHIFFNANNRDQESGDVSYDDKGYENVDTIGHELREGGNLASLPPDASYSTSLDSGVVPYSIKRFSNDEMIKRSRTFYELMDTRRSVRHYKIDPVPMEVINNVLKTAGTAPSGACTEPWTFVVVTDAACKKALRQIIEEEEEVNYRSRMGDKWLKDLEPLRTTWEKPYIEIAPCIIVVFKQVYGVTPDGKRRNHYYHEISVSIAVGILLAALTNVGLTTVTSTPMNAGPKIRSLLNRPMNERVHLVLPVGYPEDGAVVPANKRKHLEEITAFI